MQASKRTWGGFSVSNSLLLPVVSLVFRVGVLRATLESFLREYDDYH